MVDRNPRRQDTRGIATAPPVTDPPVAEPSVNRAMTPDPARRNVATRGWNATWGWALLVLILLVAAMAGFWFGGVRDFS